MRNDANTNPHHRAKKVQIGAAPYRGAPIRTCPTPAVVTDLLGNERQPTNTRNDNPKAAAPAYALPLLSGTQRGKP